MNESKILGDDAVTITAVTDRGKALLRVAADCEAGQYDESHTAQIVFAVAAELDVKILASACNLVEIRDPYRFCNNPNCPCSRSTHDVDCAPGCEDCAGLAQQQEKL